MIEAASIAALRAWRGAERRAGRRLALVPTMGALHEGHLRLVDAARAAADRVALSVFVNPLQFGPGEDLARYPRDLTRDRALAAARGVDLLFVPTAETMYPPGSETRVVPGAVANRWEGAARPGHFTGVLTVVAKLLHAAEPEVAVFGQKDAQQVMLIRQMVRDLDWPVELVVIPTAREPDGLALSSRNAYLAPDDRRQAAGLSAALQAAHEAWQAGERDAARLEELVRAHLAVYPAITVEYISCCEPERLGPVTAVDAQTIVIIAARVGPARLIDNIILGKGIA